jgi:uncharacterized membrane protein YhaH (DUF805 family)
MKYYIEVLKKYAVFQGRARRAEYWYFVLFNIIASLLLGLVDGLLGTGFIGFLYYILVFLPSLAVQVRRLHDVGKSGWWILIGLIPLIGWIWLLVLLVKDSDAGENKYGPNPKGVQNAEVVN